MRSSFTKVLIGALAAAALLGLAGPGFAATPASVAPPAVAAPAPAATPDPAAVLANDQQTLAQLQNQLPITSNDTRLAAMEAEAAAIEARADQLMASADRDLAIVNQSLKRLNPNPRRAVQVSQKPQVAALMAGRNAVQARLSLAQTVSTAASSTYNLIAERRREGFSARVLQQSASPLSPDFWSSLFDASGPDLARLEAQTWDDANTAAHAPQPRAAIGLGLGAVLALLLLFPVRRTLENLGRKAVDRKHERGGFGHMAYALWMTAVDTGAPALAAMVLHLGAQWGGLLSDKADQLAGAAVVAVTWGGGHTGARPRPGHRPGHRPSHAGIFRPDSAADSAAAGRRGGDHRGRIPAHPAQLCRRRQRRLDHRRQLRPVPGLCRHRRRHPGQHRAQPRAWR